MAKEDISNTTLATLLVVAIVVSIGGTYVVLQRTPAITGLFTGTTAQGTVNFEEQGVLSIVLTDNLVDFGIIQSTGNGTCTIASSAASGAGGGSNCEKTLGPDIMTLQNDGNVNASITVDETDNFELGTGGGFNFETTTIAAVIPGDLRDGGCIDTPATAWTPVAGGSSLCANMQPIDSADEIGIDYQLLLGVDAPPKPSQQATVTFTATLI
jgi:hypothetical protein